MPAPDAILELTAVSKVFGGLTAVNDVTLSVAAGEICGVIGPNGAGKSTLFGVIAGATPPTSGRVFFCGADVSGLPMYRRSRLGVVRTLQLADTFASLSVADNVLLGAEDHAHVGLFAALTHAGGFGADLAAARARASEALNATGIADIAHLAADRLTFGQQRLVATARALAARPRLLLLDEPAAGLSTGETETLCRAVTWARAIGITVIIVEHNMEVVMRLCDHLVVMHLGEKIGDGPPDAVRQSERVIEAYLGA
jgi:branched-chain amino acid transport system ATP-binding protein